MTLLEAVRRHRRKHGTAHPLTTPVEGLAFLYAESEKPPSHLIFKPSLCITLQGAKQTAFGGRRFLYPAGKALIVCVEMPAKSKVVQATPSEPYLGIILELDLHAMRQVIEEMDFSEATRDRDDFAALTIDVDGPLEECMLRLVRLLDTPDAIPVIAPLIMREICYWLLASKDGAAIASVLLGTSRPTRIVRAIHKLREDFNRTVRIEDLSNLAEMSTATFYREFKALTSMTPLQYQKQLRLLQAQQLLLAGAVAETAAYQVGYESPSQFSREYARMFGAPPRRHALSGAAHEDDLKRGAEKRRVHDDDDRNRQRNVKFRNKERKR